jgi:hypothetical protein
MPLYYMPLLKVAARELQKTVATVDEWAELPWAEVSKDLHRMKGIIMSVRRCSTRSACCTAARSGPRASGRSGSRSRSRSAASCW